MVTTTATVVAAAGAMVTVTKVMVLSVVASSGGLSLDFAGLGQNPVTAINQIRAALSHRAAHNITVAKFN